MNGIRVERQNKQEPSTDCSSAFHYIALRNFMDYSNKSELCIFEAVNSLGVCSVKAQIVVKKVRVGAFATSCVLKAHKRGLNLVCYSHFVIENTSRIDSQSDLFLH